MSSRKSYSVSFDLGKPWFQVKFRYRIGLYADPYLTHDINCVTPYFIRLNYVLWIQDIIHSTSCSSSLSVRGVDMYLSTFSRSWTFVNGYIPLEAREHLQYTLSLHVNSNRNGSLPLLVRYSSFCAMETWIQHILAGQILTKLRWSLPKLTLMRTGSMTVSKLSQLPPTALSCCPCILTLAPSTYHTNFKFFLSDLMQSCSQVWLYDVQPSILQQHRGRVAISYGERVWTQCREYPHLLSSNTTLLIKVSGEGMLWRRRWDDYARRGIRICI
jgi:hypothetical protein